MTEAEAWVRRRFEPSGRFKGVGKSSGGGGQRSNTPPASSTIAMQAAAATGGERVEPESSSVVVAGVLRLAGVFVVHGYGAVCDQCGLGGE